MPSYIRCLPADTTANLGNPPPPPQRAMNYRPGRKQPTRGFTVHKAKYQGGPARTPQEENFLVCWIRASHTRSFKLRKGEGPPLHRTLPPSCAPSQSRPSVLPKGTCLLYVLMPCIWVISGLQNEWKTRRRENKEALERAIQTVRTMAVGLSGGIRVSYAQALPPIRCG